MHEPRTDDASNESSREARSGDSRADHCAIPIPASGPAGELTILERLDAFRDLIRHGNALLGEVGVYCREAEAALNELAADRRAVDQMRVELEEARSRADAEANAARAAMTKVEAQRRELEDIRAELIKTRGDMDEFHRTQNKSAEILEQSLREAREQQARLEQELQRVQARTASSRTIDTRLAQLDQMEAKLRTTERDLATTRRALEDERGRRDRAIALIKPKLTADEAHS